MTRDDIIRMAKEAGWKRVGRNPETGPEFPILIGNLERFAALVAAAEREKVAAWMRSNSYATGHGDTIEDLLKELEWQVAEESAELLQALQNLHQRCHWADAPEEMDAAKVVIEKAIRARGNRE